MSSLSFVLSQTLTLVGGGARPLSQAKRKIKEHPPVGALEAASALCRSCSLNHAIGKPQAHTLARLDPAAASCATLPDSGGQPQHLSLDLTGARIGVLICLQRIYFFDCSMLL